MNKYRLLWQSPLDDVELVTSKYRNYIFHPVKNFDCKKYIYHKIILPLNRCSRANTMNNGQEINYKHVSFVHKSLMNCYSLNENFS